MFTSPGDAARRRSSSMAYGGGIFVSLFFHGFLAFITIQVLERSKSQVTEFVQVFSVTLEGGERLGGINQIPTDDSRAPKVSPVAGLEKTQPPEEKEKPEEKKEKEVPAPTIEPKETKDEEAKTKLEELPEVNKKHLEEAAMLEEKRRKEEEDKKKQQLEERKKADEKKKEEQRLLQEKEQKEKDEKIKKDLEKKEKEEKEREEKEKKEQAKLAREKKERDAKLREAIAASQQRTDGSGRSDYEGESADVGGKGFGAAALGGRGMGGGVVQSLEFVAYMNRLEQHIKAGWRWMSGSEPLQAQVMIRLAPNGVIQEASIIKSSGNAQFDESALRAVYKASPVPPPPEKLYDRFREVRLMFDPRK